MLEEVFIKAIFILCLIPSSIANVNVVNASNNQTKNCSKIWTNINLPIEHMPFFFNSNEKLRLRCLSDDSCPYKDQAEEKNLKCWGYEPNCSEEKRQFLPQCPGDSRGWVNTVKLFIKK